MEKMVVIKFSNLAISFLLLLAEVLLQTHAASFDITKYGAKADDKTDISKAVLDAWTEACAATSPSTITIPKGSYLLTQVELKGPCKAPVEIKVEGTVNAPKDPNALKSGSWISIDHVDQLTISGGGTFDGQGATAWANNDCDKNTDCKKSMNMGLNAVTNSVIRDVTSKDSKHFHVNVIGCKNLTFEHFSISAPDESLNTDGIHIGRSDGVNIIDSNIKTGDDCVSIGDGSQNVKVEKVTCGPGHGISIGSLGRYQKEDPVIGITIKNCTLAGTDNGVRVKTWPASPGHSVASGLHFEDIIMDNVGNPVLIDQGYCPYNQCSSQSPSLVKISDVTFKNIRGTTPTKVAVKLVCSSGIPCSNVQVGDIDLKYNGSDGPATSECANINPIFSGKQNPPVCATKAPTS
ncbi:exopolygalacturonase-like [Diospyros lotus]|uniref:exopolygalacturonase-like n=1 Tax=Diospyros lotus TaxID=55363 RepID=UPI0022505438|nr:exopolygalacturonase-like [Diospyros lotus]